MLSPAVAISLAGLVVSVVSVVTSACCTYLCSRNVNRTPDGLRLKVNELWSHLDELEQMQRDQAVVRKRGNLAKIIIGVRNFLLETTDSYITQLENGLDERCMRNLVRNVCVENQFKASMEKKFSEVNDLIGEAQTLLQEPVKGYKRVEDKNVVEQERRNEIWEKVSSDEENGAGTICIHGPMGVGKTAIAVSLHNQALKEEHDGIFDYVTWVTVNFGDDLKKIQEKIAIMLGIDLSLNSSLSGFGDSPVGRGQLARRIKDNLQEKKFLLVLDSMWQPLSLEEIMGVPALGRSQKLILTSRIRTICKRIKGECFFLEVQPLAPPKPWNLFDKITKFPTLQTKLTQDNDSRTPIVVQGLDGIPLAINNLAETLSGIRDDGNTDFNVAWKKELDRAENPKDPMLMTRLTPSYDNLKEETTKLCFLYCVLLPKDHPIHSRALIEYWMWEGLLDIHGKDLQGLMGDGIEILDQLKNAHLLHKEGSASAGGDKIKMLSLVRSMGAYKLAAQTQQEVTFPTGVSIFRPRASCRTSLTQSLYSDLNPDQVKGLSTLLLQDIPLSPNYHDTDFFNIMPSLRVIDLSRTGISTVPKSLSSSINLRALLLRSCRNLRMLPNLSKLQQLIVLDLSGTPLEDFPQGIKELKKLRRLDLSQTRLATFPAGVLDKLIELEELLMITNADCKGNVWGSKELGNQKQGQGPCVEELLGLEKIVLLQLSFLNGKVFDMYVNQARKRNKVPQKFRFCVGQGLQSGIAGVGENSVSIIGDPHSSTLPNTTFELHLKRCPFRKISELEVEKHCMRNLAVLGLYYITGLRYLFSGEIVKSPLMLKELRVISCKDMEEIVEPAAAEGSSATMISLPGLTKMLFSDLPQLKRIWGPKGLNCPRLDSVEVWSCPSCTELPVIYCRKRGTENPSPCKKIEIKGDSSWIQNFNNGSDASSHDPHFQFQPYPNHDFNLKFMDPAESRFTSAADYRVYMKEQQEGDKNNTMYASGFVAPQNLEEKRHGLSILIDGIKKMENRGAVLMPQLSSLIGEADALCMEVDDSLDQTSIGNRLDKLNQCTEEVQNLLLDPVKGYSQLSEVVIMGEMRTQRKEEIQEAVSDQAEGSVGTICIHGSLGVGKTAIAISIHNKALEGKLFDHVVWVDVEYGADLLKVQGAIAQSLEIMLPMNKTPDSKEERVPINASGDDIVVERAGELRNALLHMGKFLLILDSVWHPLSLNAIGIPPLVNGRKLIVTSRTRTVCDDIMNKKTFEIQPLFVGEEDEAWEIFESNIMSLPQYFLKTETVARIKEALLVELDGLPLAITKFAHNSGSHTDLDQAWRKELDKLASDPMLLDQWKYSYASLSMATRNCFLYCALFPKDYLIKRCDLIEYWRLEGLISDNNANETLAKGNHKGREALSELVNSHLLQTETGEHVKMLSNLVRSMTIYSMTKQTDLIPPHKVFIRSGCSLSKLPSEEDEECPAEVERASFMQNELQDLKLTGKMDFSRLSTLLLQDNYSLVTLNDKLFSRMPELQVLDLSQTQITTLPKSLLNLKKLCALLLRNCAKLTVLPNLSNLQQLIVLDLSGTPLLNSPKGLEKMRKLRRLDLSQTKLATFPLSVVSKLIELEELLMITAEDCVWGSSEDKLWKGPCIEDLLKLEKLAILHLHFRNKQAFDKYVNLARNYPHVLLTSRFRVGEIQRGENHEDNSPAISTLLAHSISEMFNKLNLLNLNYLDVCNLSGLSHLFSVEILKSLTQLRELRVRSCKEMVEVVQQPAQDQGEIIIISLPQLTRMLFFELPRLKSVCPGQVLHCPNLGSVQVWRCDNNLELPSILPHGDEIRIIGERTWLRNLKSDYNQAQHSDTKFIFTETDVPLEELINTRATNGIAEETMPPELTMVGYCY